MLGERVYLALVALSVSQLANAAPVLIDFTDEVWSQADNQASFSVDYGSFTVTATSAQDPGLLTFNSPGPAEPDFLAGFGDGLGVSDDEISWLEPDENNEVLDIFFSEGVTVLAYYLLDLFAGEGPNGEGELARVNFQRTGPNTVFSDEGTATNGAGFYAREGLSVTNFDEITFTASSYAQYSAAESGFSDFSLAAILVDDGRVVSVSEPNSALLFALGALLLCRVTQRRFCSIANRA